MVGPEGDCEFFPLNLLIPLQNLHSLPLPVCGIVHPLGIQAGVHERPLRQGRHRSMRFHGNCR